MLADPFASLTTIVEFAIGIAGFSAVIAVLGGREHWSEQDRVRTHNLIVFALVPGFLSLLALAALSQIDVIGASRIVSVFAFVIGIIVWVASRRRSLVAFGVGAFSTQNPINTAIFSFYALLVLFNIPVFLGLFGSYAFTLFYLHLVGLLLIASINFYRLVFKPVSDSNNP